MNNPRNKLNFQDSQIILTVAKAYRQIFIQSIESWIQPKGEMLTGQIQLIMMRPQLTELSEF